MRLEFLAVVEPASLLESILAATPHLRGRLLLFADEGRVIVETDAELGEPEVRAIEDAVAMHDALSAYKAKAFDRVKHEAHSLLAPTDWYIIRAQETGKPVPDAVLQWRAAIRAATVRAEAEIAALTDVESVRVYRVQWPEKPEGVWW